jgi:hypothetical protein
MLHSQRAKPPRAGGGRAPANCHEKRGFELVAQSVREPVSRSIILAQFLWTLEIGIPKILSFPLDAVLTVVRRARQQIMVPPARDCASQFIANLPRPLTREQRDRERVCIRSFVTALRMQSPLTGCCFPASQGTTNPIKIVLSLTPIQHLLFFSGVSSFLTRTFCTWLFC